MTPLNLKEHHPRNKKKCTLLLPLLTYIDTALYYKRFQIVINKYITIQKETT